jgi:hypothetical protein
MTAIVWPDTLLPKAVLRSGFKYTQQSAIERTEMDSGLARGRMFNGNPTAMIPVQFAMSEFQVAVYKEWRKSSSRFGANWFEIDLPLEGNTYRTVLAREHGEPSFVPRGAASVTVSTEFEIHDSTVLPDGVIELMTLLGLTGTQDMAAALAGVTLQPAFDLWGAYF